MIDQGGLSSVRPPVVEAEPACIQSHGFLLVLSLDWIVLRASENVHKFLGESHVTLIGEPLGNFVQADPLHDLRNLFSRLSGTTGVAHAYRVRLTDRGSRFDIAFQVVGGKVLIEGVPSSEHGLGEAIGAVAGLIDGMTALRGGELLNAAARRMRALTGFDRVTLDYDGNRVESRSAGAKFTSAIDDGPRLLGDLTAPPVALFPRSAGGVDAALLCAPTADEADSLRGGGIASRLQVAMVRGGKVLGWFRCDSHAPRPCNFEIYAATELFAQMVALQLEIDRRS